MFAKIKSSLIVQTNYLFLLSIVFIVILWITFYTQQIHQNQEHKIVRYFNTATTIQPKIIKKEKITNENLDILSMRIISKDNISKYEVVFEKGNKQKGFALLKTKDKNILHLYNSVGEIYLEDIHKDDNIFLIHFVFVMLLVFQVFLYFKLSSSLKPLSILSNKLKNLEQGDRTHLGIDSNYEEIKQIITSYNDSISKIDYMLETREMFNKIFMHEMKTPLAKGMFYLKLEPSQKTHEKLLNILKGINDELDEFSQIESLIAYQNDIDKTQYKFIEVLDLAKSRLDIKDDEIELINMDSCILKGDKEFWALCIKNLLDNAIKYSQDKKITIEYKNSKILFINKGEPLPVDISQDIKKWKIDKNKRHKSSTGYGFGLFIIKNIVELHGYKLGYTYDEINYKVFLFIE